MRHAIAGAVATVRQQGRIIEELRVAAVQHADESGWDSARAALMDVYSRFEEGHTLPDLRMAADLLGLQESGCLNHIRTSSPGMAP